MFNEICILFIDIQKKRQIEIIIDSVFLKNQYLFYENIIKFKMQDYIHVHKIIFLFFHLVKMDLEIMDISQKFCELINPL